MGNARELPGFLQRRINQANRNNQSQEFNHDSWTQPQQDVYPPQSPEKPSMSATMNTPMSKSQSQPHLRTPNMRSSKMGLQPTAGNILHKAFHSGNTDVDHEGIPKFYKNNYPIQSITQHQNKISKGKPIGHR